MKKSKIFAAIGVASAAAAGVMYAATKMLVKTALDREQPQIMKKSGDLISGGKQDEKFTAAYKSAAKKLGETEHETIQITSHDNIKLVGHYFPCENPKRVIIAFHGWRSSWTCDYGMISDFWHKNGCSVIYVEQRGQNNSGGEYMGFGLTERYDCVDWVEEAIRLCGDEIPIYLAGVSMGAATVLMAADLKLPKNVHGIMADCGFTSPRAIWKHVANNNLHISYGMPGAIADAFCRKKILVNSDDHSTTEALGHTNIPVLFVHGTDDKFVPVEMTYENYKACVSPKKLLVIPGADHAMSYYTDKNSYEKNVLEFWDEFDLKEPQENTEDEDVK